MDIGSDRPTSSTDGIGEDYNIADEDSSLQPMNPWTFWPPNGD